jgi:hypothetical protein
VDDTLQGDGALGNSPCFWQLTLDGRVNVSSIVAELSMDTGGAVLINGSIREEGERIRGVYRVAAPFTDCWDDAGTFDLNRLSP